MRRPSCQLTCEPIRVVAGGLAVVARIVVAVAGESAVFETTEPQRLA